MAALERFADKHILVTGAGTGIGRAIALRLAAEGAVLSLLARDVARLEATAAAAPGGAHVGACDVRERSSVDAAFEAAAAAHGPLHAVIANAGVGGPNEAGDEDRFDDLVATNLTGTYSCFRAAERHLAAGPDLRHLVAVSSILARIGVPGYTGYCASKAGITGLVRSLGAELAPEGVQVNAVCPGWVDTDMAHEGLAGMAQSMNVSVDEAQRVALQSVPMGKMSQPEDVAGLIAWLVSDDARGVVGQCIDMNGGAFMI